MSKFGFVGVIIVKLKDCCILLTDGDWIESKDQSASGIRLIQTGNVGNGEYLEKENRAKYISEETFKKLGCTEIFPGDILVSRLPDPVGRACLIPEKDERMITAVDCSILRVDESKLNKRYLLHFLKSSGYYSQLSGKLAGTTRIRVSRKNLEQVVIEVPDRESQELVVAVIDKLETVIQMQKAILRHLDELTKARFVEMFGEPIRNTQNRKTTEFINVVKMQRGFDLPVQERRQDGGIPVYGSNGALDHHNVAKVQGGGVITGRSGTIGKVFYTECDYWPLNTSLFSVDTHCNNVIYLAYLIEMFDLSRFVEGTGVPTLNRNMFHNKQIIDVELTEQNQFATFVRQVDKSKVVVQNHSKICYNRTIFTNRTLWHKESASREKKYDN